MVSNVGSSISCSASDNSATSYDGSASDGRHHHDKLRHYNNRRLRNFGSKDRSSRHSTDCRLQLPLVGPPLRRDRRWLSGELRLPGELRRLCELTRLGSRREIGWRGGYFRAPWGLRAPLSAPGLRSASGSVRMAVIASVVSGPAPGMGTIFSVAIVFPYISEFKIWMTRPWQNISARC
jgi:hypothetical protein